MSVTDHASRIKLATPPSTGAVGIGALPDYDDTERRDVTKAAFDRIRRHTDPDIRREAVDEVVLANLGVARSLAYAYRERGIPRDDLEQVAYTALIAAANRFLPKEGRDFLAFAVPTIRGQLKRHFRDHGWTVRPPRRVQEIQFRALAARDRLAESLDRAPSIAEIARDLGESDKHVSQALSLDGCFTPSSLDVRAESGTATLGDLVPDPGTDAKQAAEARVMLGPVVRELSERDRYVLRLRFFECLTQKEIGDKLGITQTQVSRILTRITRHLREHLSSPSASSPQQLAQIAS